MPFRYRRTPSAFLLAATALMALPLASSAQATRDQSRLVIGVSAGYIGGRDLWSVAEQPIRTNTEATDIFRIDRSLRSNITVIGHATWFPRANFGLSGEISYVGLGTLDGCALIASSGDPLNRLACAALNGNARPASAVGLGVGGVFRPASRAFLQPYARVTTGIALAPRSTVRTVATIGVFGDTAFTIYPDVGNTEAKLTGSVVLGLATSASPGYQFRVEVRNSWVRLPIVTGATAFQGLTPPITSVWTALPSILFGFDIVLEKRRGRRY